MYGWGDEDLGEMNEDVQVNYCSSDAGAPSAPSSMTAAVVTIRKDFPESWIWQAFANERLVDSPRHGFVLFCRWGYVVS